MLPEIEITEKMQEWAKRKAEEFKNGPHYNDGFEAPHRKFTGYLGEAAFWKFYPTAKHVDGPHYDFLLSGVPYDVKTQVTKCLPNPNYAVNVTDKDLKGRGQPGVRYFFVYLTPDFKRVTLVGWIPYVQFVELAQFMKKGEPPRCKNERALPNGYLDDCWEIPASVLWTPYELEEE